MKKSKKPRYEDREAILQKIGERMRELRKEKGYSNYETFAYENNIPRAQYGRYEQGSDLKLSSLLKVLDGLDMTLEEFFSVGF
jgi:transcriptional regulator with XRE-family HTH domain